MQFTISLKTRFFLVVLSRWKGNKFQISMKFHLKNWKTYFESLISPSFNELHCSTIVHMNHMEHMFQDLPFYCTKKVPKNYNHFFHFSHGGGTHFLVLAQTLIYSLQTYQNYIKFRYWNFNLQKWYLLIVCKNKHKKDKSRMNDLIFIIMCSIFVLKEFWCSARWDLWNTLLPYFLMNVYKLIWFFKARGFLTIRFLFGETLIIKM